ncbi:hypothetical protein E5675_04070 [Sphingopyxis sp. PAMC25046]|uniref:hypothetical protein n=1 Tax=Sphingopyxis sp. PAMC25046 TaxID=2565556 RepID=UPI00109DD29B|nr:hypothetical protein [Sphingopyxis sp. PAMC25046]QCB53693.1 hypothetical protein E5675_04070 [Sphingopyxis sp. PAMC25046]
MRQTTGIVVFATLAIIVFTLALVQQEPRYDDEACDIALQVLKDLRYENGAKLAVSSKSAHLNPMTRRQAEEFAADFRSDHVIDAEGERLLDLFVKGAVVAKVKPVEACANIRAWLAASRILHDEDKIEAATREKEKFPFVIVEISMPVVSKDRAHAQIWISTTYGSLAGGGGPAELQRDKGGRWRIRATSSIWVS